MRQMDSFLGVCFLFEVFFFKNVCNTVDNIRGCKKGTMKAKTTPIIM
jgi:hypothetical protein